MSTAGAYNNQNTVSHNEKVSLDASCSFETLFEAQAIDQSIKDIHKKVEELSISPKETESCYCESITCKSLKEITHLFKETSAGRYRAIQALFPLKDTSTENEPESKSLTQSMIDPPLKEASVSSTLFRKEALFEDSFKPYSKFLVDNYLFLNRNKTAPLASRVSFCESTNQMAQHIFKRTVTPYKLNNFPQGGHSDHTAERFDHLITVKKTLKPSARDLLDARQEAGVALHLDSPYVLKPLAITGKSAYYPYFKRKDLFFVKRSSLTQSSYLRIVFEIARAIKTMHDNDYVHGDIKTENVFITDNLSARLADFDSTLKSDAITKNTKTFGTPATDAPEKQAGNTIYGKPSDVWSFALLMFELLFNATPISTAVLDVVGNTRQYWAYQKRINPTISDQELERLITEYNKKQKQLLQKQINDCILNTSNLTRWMNSQRMRSQQSASIRLIDPKKAIQALCLACLKENPDERPTIDEIVEQLDQMQTPRTNIFRLSSISEEDEESDITA